MSYSPIFASLSYATSYNVHRLLYKQKAIALTTVDLLNKFSAMDGRDPLNLEQPRTIAMIRCST